MEDARTLTKTARDLAMAARATEVLDRVMRGETFREVARETGLTLGQVKSAVRRAQADVKRIYLDKALDRRARLIAKNHALQKELWKSYERVKANGKVSQTKRGDMTEITQSTAPEAEARLLHAILKAQEAEAKLSEVIAEGEPEKVGDNSINIGKILIVNNAQLESEVPWVASIPARRIKQGPDPVEFEAEFISNEPDKLLNE